MFHIMCIYTAFSYQSYNYFKITIIETNLYINWKMFQIYDNFAIIILSGSRSRVLLLFHLSASSFLPRAVISSVFHWKCYTMQREIKAL